MSFLGLEEEKIEPEKSVQQKQEAAALAEQANTIFIVSCISLLFCCLGGAIATYFAYNAKQDANMGNAEGAKHNIRMAKGWMIATFIIGILGIIGKLSEGR
jgi:heme/copper-type cytochrome/quinol oxidase subunit 2